MPENKAWLGYNLLMVKTAHNVFQYLLINSINSSCAIFYHPNPLVELTWACKKGSIIMMIIAYLKSVQNNHSNDEENEVYRNESFIAS